MKKISIRSWWYHTLSTILSNLWIEKRHRFCSLIFFLLLPVCIISRQYFWSIRSALKIIKKWFKKINICKKTLHSVLIKNKDNWIPGNSVLVSVEHCYSVTLQGVPDVDGVVVVPREQDSTWENCLQLKLIKKAQVNLSGTLENSWT